MICDQNLTLTADDVEDFSRLAFDGDSSIGSSLFGQPQGSYPTITSDAGLDFTAPNTDYSFNLSENETNYMIANHRRAPRKVSLEDL